VGHRLVEAFDLAVGAWPVGPRLEVSDLFALEEAAQVTAAAVLHRVVGHQSLRADLVFGEAAERSLEERDHGRCFLVVVDLGVGEAGMVVDDRVHDVDAVEVSAVLAGAVAGDPVAGALEARVLAGVHVRQVAGAGPLVAGGRLPRRPRRPGDPRSPEHLPDRRVAETGRAGHQAWAPARRASAGADRLGELGRELPGRAVRPTRAIKQTRPRRLRLLGRVLPAVPPTMRRRRRHAEGGRGRLQRHPLLDRADERVPASQSELRVTVIRHPSPPSVQVFGETHSLEGGPDRTLSRSQPL